jgi:hypothetical protein
MKRVIVMLALMLLVSGCAYMREQMGYGPYIPPEPSSFEIALDRYNEVWKNFYQSDLSIWVGKSIGEVRQAFLVEYEGEKCCGPDIHSLDVYGNGYISYKKQYLSNFYSSGRLTFYIKRNRIYNVVKE